MKFKKIISIALMILATDAATHAEVVAGRWEKVEALAPGTAVIVSLQGGERLECTINKIQSDEILFTEINGQERRVPKSAILKIESAAVVRDRLRNGILTGALVGAAGGIAAVVAGIYAKTNGPVYWDEDGPAYILGGALAAGGIGAAVGGIIDASVKNREVFYRVK